MYLLWLSETATVCGETSPHTWRPGRPWVRNKNWNCATFWRVSVEKGTFKVFSSIAASDHISKGCKNVIGVGKGWRSSLLFMVNLVHALRSCKWLINVWQNSSRHMVIVHEFCVFMYTKVLCGFKRRPDNQWRAFRPHFRWNSVQRGLFYV